MSVTFCRTVSGTPAGVTRARVGEAAGLDDAAVARALEAGLLPVETARAEAPAIAWVVDPPVAMELLARGVPGWRISVRRAGARADVLDALVRTGAAFLRTDAAGLEEAIELGWLPGISTRVSVAVDTLADALDAIAAGAVDLVVGDWGPHEVGALREAIAPRALVERTALPPETEIDDARDMLARPLFTAWLGHIDGSGASRPRYSWAPGRDEDPPVPPRRLSAEWDDAAWRQGDPDEGFSRIDPDLAGILERSLADTPPRVAEIERLFRARGPEVEAIARVADTLRARRCGDTVTYVVNRNINYTNQCYFRCGFCGFSRGPKSLNLRGDPYILNVHEVVHRSVEAWERGATEVCLQGGIHPDFDGDFYVSVLEGIKARLPEMHVHGFTPLEVWQGAHTLGISVREFLMRLRDAGLGTLPGTAAEILDDRVRVHLCPDKVRTAEWAEVMITAHELGLRVDHHDDDGPHRRAAGVGQPPRGAAPDPAAHRRVHRVRPAPVRPHGLADLLAGQVPPGADLGRGRPRARGRANRPRRSDRQHPGLLGEARPVRWRAAARRRLQRPRRDPDGREHLPRLGGRPRPAGHPRGARGRDPQRRPHPGAAHHGLRSGGERRLAALTTHLRDT